MPFLRSYYEFDKNANSISMNAEVLYVLKWFGDYRSLRFLCGYFGSRTFCFWVRFLSLERTIRANIGEKLEKI